MNVCIQNTVRTLRSSSRLTKKVKWMGWPGYFTSSRKASEHIQLKVNRREIERTEAEITSANDQLMSMQQRLMKVGSSDPVKQVTQRLAAESQLLQHTINWLFRLSMLTGDD